jgi:hypothetical protein
VRKLNKEKDELKKENESLKKKIQDFDKLERSEHLSARSSVRFLIFQTILIHYCISLFFSE